MNAIIAGDITAPYHALVSGIAELKLAYLHLEHAGDEDLVDWVRTAWPAALFVNQAGRPREPDLVARLKSTTHKRQPGKAFMPPRSVTRLAKTTPLP